MNRLYETSDYNKEKEMNYTDLTQFKEWFSGYAKSFYSSDKDDQRNIYLKVEHTYNVCSNIIQIAKEQALSEDMLMLAETIGLFHDVGRFPQYARYRTFRDSTSVNHGELGSEVLKEEKVLDSLPKKEQDIILNAVKFHNAFSLPALDEPETLLFLRLIRDADKLDIWRVFTEYYESAPEERASAAGLGLPDTPEYSETVLSYIYKNQIASISEVRTLNDFKLLQLSWVYDLNFKPSFRMLKERNYIHRLASTLPNADKLKKAVSLLEEFVNRKLND
jgi:hypothetical protein